MSTIDVAVPCYQYGRFIADCIGSITAQNVKGLRILVFDNGSADDSLRTAYELAARDPHGATGPGEAFASPSRTVGRRARRA
jgi:glycosyltransferase involved in cell wall biosynthesis